MSLNQSVYLGAYLLVPHIVQPHPLQAYECSVTAEHRVSLHDRFCRECGAPALRKDKVTQRIAAVHCRQIKAGEFEDAFWSPESPRSDTMSLWLPNTRDFGTFVEEVSATEQLADLDPQYLLDCKQRLAERYAPLLEALKAEKGVTAKVQAGVVVYWN